MKYNDYVIRSILANNQFGITAVNQLESLKSLYFIKEEYRNIENLIKSKDFKAIQDLLQGDLRNGEYLEIMAFKDQNANDYVVTVYDSDALEQDPQVIEIYS